MLNVTAPPKVVRLKLFLEPLSKLDVLALDALHHRLHVALLFLEPCELRYSENYIYRNVLCTDASARSSLSTDEVCKVEFACFDPISYSRVKSVETSKTFEVGGTWATWPVVELVADGSEEITVISVDTTMGVMLTGGFAEGAVVAMDYESETATVDGVAASERITLASKFAALRLGAQKLSFAGVSEHSVSFYEWKV